MLQKEYKTVFKKAGAETEEKKSRFIASVKPVSSEAEALEFINEIKTRYWDASHNVYSYYIGGNNIIQRFSDDGEPSGTAGMPVLEVIKKMGVQDLAVVVTRYFGGTLLGAAGLIRAYGKCASAGIENAVIVKRQLCTEINIIVEYTLFGKLRNMLDSNGYTVKEVVYGQDAEITVYIPEGGVEAFMKAVTEATSARAVAEVRNNLYITVDEKGRAVLEK